MQILASMQKGRHMRLKDTQQQTHTPSRHNGTCTLCLCLCLSVSVSMSVSVSVSVFVVVSMSVCMTVSRMQILGCMHKGRHIRLEDTQWQTHTPSRHNGTCTLVCVNVCVYVCVYVYVYVCGCGCGCVCGCDGVSKANTGLRAERETHAT